MDIEQTEPSQGLNKKANLVSTILALVVFIALGKYLYDNIDIFESLQKLELSHIATLVLFYLVFILMLSYLNMAIIHKLEPKVGSVEIVALQFINTLLNKILPKGGVAFRAMYFKNRYQLSYSYFLATFTGLIVVGLPSQALISMFAMLAIYLKTGVYNLIVIAGFAAILLGSLFIMIFRPSFPSTNNRILKAVNRLVEGWNIIVEDLKDLTIFVLLSMVTFLIDSFNMFFVFYALGTPIMFSTALLLSSLSTILSFINITPDGLGVREGVYLYIAAIIAIPEPQILFGSLVQRAVSFSACLFFGGLSYVYITSRRQNPAIVD